MKLRPDQIISIEAARQLLGDDAEGMSDEDIERLILDFDIIAQYTIQLIQEFKTKDNNERLK